MFLTLRTLVIKLFEDALVFFNFFFNFSLILLPRKKLADTYSRTPNTEENLNTVHTVLTFERITLLTRGFSWYLALS